MSNETFIPMQDVIYRINTHPDLTPKDKKEFAHITNSLYMSDKGKEKILKPTLTNQQRNKKNNL
jgi:hypothetical protein